MSDNSVTIVGNLTRDPELRFTAGGRAVASFGVAVSRRWKAGSEWVEQTSFFNVVCWGQLGENAAESFTKGARVIVTGRLEQRQYESGGQSRSTVEIVAEDVGPSLRWATAIVTRPERSSAAGSNDSKRGEYDAAYPYGAEPYGAEEPF